MGSSERKRGGRRTKATTPRAYREAILFCAYEVTQSDTNSDARNPSWFSSTGGGKEMVAGLDTSSYPIEQSRG